MKTVTLDAVGWTSAEDFRVALLAALGAPDWHGDGIDALIDSIVYGDINAIDPPFVIAIENGAARPDVRRYVDHILYHVLDSAREEGHGPDWIQVRLD